ncbi:MAG TPA: YafY family protein [Spirochaetia bacterium]|nr:YafY family protein [Spirochaetia bacterium]
MYHPTGRVLTVLELLQSRPGLTGPEIARRLETDVRTVRRYITKLQDVGIPVEANPGRFGGYHLRPGFKLPPLLFSEHEAIAVALGLLASPWLEVDLPSEAVEGALSKVTRVLPDAVRERVLAMSSAMILSSYRDDSRPDASLLMRLSDSAQARRCVDVTYRSDRNEITRRVVEPYGVVGRQGKWYLVGWCRLRQDYRTFRLDRMQETLPLTERFEKREDFDLHAYALRSLENYPVNFHIRVRFQADPARVHDRIPASLGTLSGTPEGVVLDWPIDDLDYGARYLLARGVPFVVLDPPELRDVFRRLAAEAARIADAG